MVEEAIGAPLQAPAAALPAGAGKARFYSILEDTRGRCLIVVKTARPGRFFGPLVHAAFRGGR